MLVTAVQIFPAVFNRRAVMQEKYNYLKLLGIALFAMACSACYPDHVRDGRGYGVGGYGQPATSTAGIWHSDIRARIERARNWIDNGEARGMLTWAETTRLRRELNAIIHQVEAFQNDDNRVSHRDREQIHNSLVHLERAIYKESYDDQYRRR